MEELLLHIFCWGIFVGGGTAFMLFAFFMQPSSIGGILQSKKKPEALR